MSFLFGILIIIVGVILIIKPMAVFRIERSLFIKNGEPTKFYFIMARVSGVLAILVGILVMLYA